MTGTAVLMPETEDMPDPMADVIDLEAYRPVWLVAQVACASCGNLWVSVMHQQCVIRFVECPRCHKMTGYVVRVYD